MARDAARSQQRRALDGAVLTGGASAYIFVEPNGMQKIVRVSSFSTALRSRSNPAHRSTSPARRSRRPCHDVRCQRRTHSNRTCSRSASIDSPQSCSSATVHRRHSTQRSRSQTPHPTACSCRRRPHDLRRCRSRRNAVGTAIPVRRRGERPDRRSTNRGVLPRRQGRRHRWVGTVRRTRNTPRRDGELVRHADPAQRSAPADRNRRPRRRCQGRVQLRLQRHELTALRTTASGTRGGCHDTERIETAQSDVAIVPRHRRSARWRAMPGRPRSRSRHGSRVRRPPRRAPRAGGSPESCRTRASSRASVPGSTGTSPTRSSASRAAAAASRRCGSRRLTSQHVDLDEPDERVDGKSSAPSSRNCSERDRTADAAPRPSCLSMPRSVTDR